MFDLIRFDLIPKYILGLRSHKLEKRLGPLNHAFYVVEGLSGGTKQSVGGVP